MDGLGWLMADLMNEQRHREVALARRVAPARASAGLKHTLATIIVRLGLRLDPAAGEGLSPAFGAPLMRQKGGC
jgi:hypothetical protein